MLSIKIKYVSNHSKCIYDPNIFWYIIYPKSSDPNSIQNLDIRSDTD